MSITDFVESLIREYRGTLEPMDLDTAKIDLNNFKRDGWDLPEGITPEEYAETWNELIANS